jgi:hypothetical protein
MFESFFVGLTEENRLTDIQPDNLIVAKPDKIVDARHYLQCAQPSMASLMTLSELEHVWNAS